MNFVRYNYNRICDMKSFRAELEKVRACGYGLDKGEEINGVNCVGAPVFDAHGYPVASIWITGPSERIRNEQLDEVGKLVRNYADMISARLGYGLF